VFERLYQLLGILSVNIKENSIFYFIVFFNLVVLDFKKFLFWGLMLRLHDKMVGWTL